MSTLSIITQCQDQKGKVVGVNNDLSWISKRGI